MESCSWSPDKQFSFKYFQNMAFVIEISPKLPGGGGCYRPEMVNACSYKKQPDNVDEIFQPKPCLGKYLKEKCSSRLDQQLFFKYFVKLFSISKLMTEVSQIYVKF